MTDARNSTRDQQSAALLEELLAQTLDERWRLLTERDLRLRRLTDRDFALFCQQLGIRPPPGLMVIHPDWQLPAPIPAHWVQEPEVGTGSRRFKTLLQFVVLGLVLTVAATQGVIVYRLSQQDDGTRQQEILTQASTAASQAGRSAQMVASVVTDFERLRSSFAAGQLRQALTSGQPFEGALAVVAASPGLQDQTRADLNALKPFAATGIPVRGDLRYRFSEVVTAVIADIDTTFAAAFCRRVDTLFRINLCSRHSVAWVLAGLRQASGALSSGDLAEAVKILDRYGVDRMLPAPSASVFTPWMTAARARLLADPIATSLARTAFSP